jgi:hypothetical protein
MAAEIHEIDGNRITRLRTTVLPAKEAEEGA